MDVAPRTVTMDSPVACVIRVEGVLDPWWSDHLGGLQITVSPTGETATSELRGELLDQAALVGVLTTLYDLGLPLLALTCAPPRSRAEPPDGVAA